MEPVARQPVDVMLVAGQEPPALVGTVGSRNKADLFGLSSGARGMNGKGGNSRESSDAKRDPEPDMRAAHC